MEQELRKIFRRFHHPQTKNILAVLKRAAPDELFPVTHADLENIRAIRDVCQREAAASHRFLVSLPYEDYVLNRVVCMDLMKLNGKTVLHAVNRDT